MKIITIITYHRKDVHCRTYVFPRSVKPTDHAPSASIAFCDFNYVGRSSNQCCPVSKYGFKLTPLKLVFGIDKNLLWLGKAGYRSNCRSSAPTNFFVQNYLFLIVFFYVPNKMPKYSRIFIVASFMAQINQIKFVNDRYICNIFLAILPYHYLYTANCTINKLLSSQSFTP